MCDSDQFVAELRKIEVGPDDYLVTFDVVRLYPSIPHKLGMVQKLALKITIMSVLKNI